MKKKDRKAWLFQKLVVILHSQQGSKKQHRALVKNLGPFVYRLGREIFIL